MRTKSRTGAIAVTVALCVTLAAGCGTTPGQTGADVSGVRQNAVTAQNSFHSSPHVARMISRLPGVRSATVLVTGDTAYVAVKPTNDAVAAALQTAPTKRQGTVSAYGTGTATGAMVTNGALTPGVQNRHPGFYDASERGVVRHFGSPRMAPGVPNPRVGNPYVAGTTGAAAGQTSGTTVPGAGHVVGNAAAGTGRVAGNVVSGAGNVLGSAAAGAGNVVGRAAAGTGRVVGDVASGTAGVAGNVAAGTLHTTGRAMGRTGTPVGNTAAGAANAVGNAAGGTANAVGNVAGGLANAAGNVVGGAANAVGNVVGGAAGAVGNAAGGAANAVGNAGARGAGTIGQSGASVAQGTAGPTAPGTSAPSVAVPGGRATGQYGDLATGFPNSSTTVGGVTGGNRSFTGTLAGMPIHTRIVNIVRTAEPSVRNVYVTTDPTVNTKFQTYASSIQNGRTTASMWNDFRNTILTHFTGR